MGLKLFFETGSIKGIQSIHSQKIKNILTILDNLSLDYGLKPLEPHFYKLHKLKGDMQNLLSVTINGNWRITFEYDEKTSDVNIVDYQDYH